MIVTSSRRIPNPQVTMLTKINIIWSHILISPVALGGVMFIVLATGLMVLRLKPSRESWIFKGDKSP
jgi:hypothetical protein